MTTEKGSNSYINNSCGRLSERSTTSTYFLPENKDWDDVIFLWYGPWIHLQKEAESSLRESDFLQRYSLDWEAYDQEQECETYYSR